MHHSVIIVAGGIGSRMNSAIPKQFMQLSGRPVLFYTIEAFFNWNTGVQIIVVLPENQYNEWGKLIKQYSFKISHKICPGGNTRFHSVQNGLKLIEEEDTIVAIHDGVRPLIGSKMIQNCYDAAALKGAAIPAIALKDSIRIVSQDSSNKAVNRNDYRIIQTPQCFKASILKTAYKQSYNSAFTDDASVVEAAGNSIELIEGDQENIKITTGADLLYAETLIKRQSILSASNCSNTNTGIR